MAWIPKDVLAELYQYGELEGSVAELIRAYMGIERHAKNKRRRTRYRSYDVTQLAIGESKSFDLTMFNIYALKRSVQKYSNESGKKFISHVVGTCATVTRTL